MSRLYYAALQQFDEAEELDDLYCFLESQTIKTWQRTLDRNIENKSKRNKLKFNE